MMRMTGAGTPLIAATASMVSPAAIVTRIKRSRRTRVVRRPTPELFRQQLRLPAGAVGEDDRGRRTIFADRRRKRAAHVADADKTECIHIVCPTSVKSFPIPLPSDFSRKSAEISSAARIIKGPGMQRMQISMFPLSRNFPMCEVLQDTEYIANPPDKTKF